MSKYADLVHALKALERRIFVHASLNQLESVQSFLLVAVRKVKLENDLSLIANWDGSDIIKKKINIIISAQNEIPNIVHVEGAFTNLTSTKFEHLRFIKFIEYLSDEKNLNELSTTITTHGTTTDETVVKVGNLKFHVAKYGTDEYGRSIKLNVYVNEIVDLLLKPSAEEDHWTPDPNLFYLLDLVFGEYYMTKHITTINFFPAIIMPADTQFLSAAEAKENIDILLGLEHERCSNCNIPEYRTSLNNQKACINCK